MEQQWWQSGVTKMEISLIFKNDARSYAGRVTTWLSFKNLLTVSTTWRLLFTSLYWSPKSMVRTVWHDRPNHRISIPAYAVEQQWWQSGVPKSKMSLMSFIFKIIVVLYQSVSISGSISSTYWNASKWSSISFSHWQCPLEREFSFPRFVGLLILSLWFLFKLIEKLMCDSKKKICPMMGFWVRWVWFEAPLLGLKFLVGS
jgi:hypothetical protein